MVSHTFESNFALKSRTYRRFLYGSFFVRTTDWMELTILNWVVYQWTNSPIDLGLVNACRLLPVFFFSLPAGSIADRFNRRYVLILLYGAMFFMTLWITHIIGGQSSFTLLLAVIALKSILMNIEVPIRNAYLSDIVPVSMLGSAITLQTACINIARMIGPALSGVLLTYYSPANILLGVSYGTLLVLFSLLTISNIEQTVEDKKPQQKMLKETFYYLKKKPILLQILIIAIGPMIFGFPYTTMLPLLSEELMDTGAQGFGLLLSVSSVGAIVSTIALSWYQPPIRGRWLILSSLGFGSGLILFTIFCKYNILSFVFMFLVGFFSQYYRTMSRIMIQLKVDKVYRGRVISIALMDRGYIPLGAILIGYVGNSFGAFSAGLFMGVGTIILTLIISGINRKLWKE